VGSAFGWHLIVVVATRRAAALPFADCRDAIVSELYDDRRQAGMRQWLECRLAQAVEVPEGADHPLSPGLPRSAHRY
jgi:hypothetical protein